MRTFGLACLCSLILFLSGCGNVFVRASWTGGTQTVSGLVSIVQFTVVSDANTAMQVTVVTLTNGFGSTSETLCGDQRNQFPINDLVQATFQPAPAVLEPLQRGDPGKLSARGLPE